VIRKNIYANFVGQIWAFISVYLFVPLYLKYLGIEAFGLVGFYSTLLGLMAFADLGFTATLKRELARLSADATSGRQQREYVRTYERAYIFISIFVSILIWILAPLIAEKWLHSNVLSPKEITMAIRMMGIAIALQLPAGLYIGGLMGLERQISANAIQIGWGVFRGLGAVFVLWFYSPTVVAFASWQALSNLTYCVLARNWLWRALPPGRPSGNLRSSRSVIQETWHYAAGMFGLAAVSTLLRQADKLAVSKMLPLNMLGYYSLAVAIAAAPITLAGPIASAVFPRLTGLAANRQDPGLERLYMKASEFVAAVVVPGGLTLAVFSSDFIRAWTGAADFASQAGPVATVLICGQILQATTIIPYYLGLAYGDFKYPLYVAGLGLVLVIPMLFIMISRSGLMGAGLSWLFYNLVTFLPYMYLVHRDHLMGRFGRWSWISLGRPLLAALPGVLIAKWLLPRPSSRLLTFCLLGLVLTVALALLILASPVLREESRAQILKVLGSNGKHEPSAV
jgi:O-antigen/teichoic acid export membrane protein